MGLKRDDCVIDKTQLRFLSMPRGPNKDRPSPYGKSRPSGKRRRLAQEWRSKPYSVSDTVSSAPSMLHARKTCSNEPNSHLQLSAEGGHSSDTLWRRAAWPAGQSRASHEAQAVSTHGAACAPCARPAGTVAARKIALFRGSEAEIGAPSAGVEAPPGRFRVLFSARLF